ncbi:tetratricopeptide repeat protein [Halostreptopolyspora alba]|uniref:Tetratricopeptide repeat protein n=1 Tax=Halostreptopolyspora alba TaxID=2487137 RepID=A0A3N0E2Y1_9ACTN|nr:tetratricopeptide repeat protein [Nocardiopsaceae bacterium YIM 96095]
MSDDTRRRGAHLHRLGRPNEALRHFERAIAENPDDTLAWTHKAEVHMNLGQHEAGLEAAQRALGLGAEFSPPYIIAGTCLVFLGRPNDALAMVEPLLRMDPDDSNGHMIVAMAKAELYRRGEPDRKPLAAEARAYAARALELDPHEDPVLHYQASLVHRWLGDRSATVGALHEVLRLHPEFTKAMRGLADLHARGFRLRRALRLYESATVLSPHVDPTPLMLAAFRRVLRWIVAPSLAVGATVMVARFVDPADENPAQLFRFVVGVVLVCLAGWPVFQVVGAPASSLRFLRRVPGFTPHVASVLVLAVSALALAWLSGSIAGIAFAVFVAAGLGVGLTHRRLRRAR